MSRDEVERFRITTWPSVIDSPDFVAVPPLIGYADAGDVVPTDAFTLEPVADAAELVALPAEALEKGMEATALRRAGDDEGARLATEAALAAAGLTVQDLPRLAEAMRARFPLPTFQGPTLMFDESHFRTKRLVDELWLREFLDVEDSDDVIQFVGDWGPLVLPQSLLVAPDVVRLSPNLRGGALEIGPLNPLSAELVSGDNAIGEHRTFIYEYLYDSLRDAPSSGEMAAMWSTRLGDAVVTVSANSYDMESQYVVVDLYQAVFETLIAIDAADLHVAALSERPRPELVEPWAARELPKPEVTLDAIDSVIDAISSGASSLGPRVELGHPDLEVRGGAFGRPIPRVVAAMCTQALHWIAEGVAVRVCANENCRGWFSRQRGRAAAGQYRSSGVLYCSASCAKAQAQREYRRRAKNAS